MKKLSFLVLVLFGLTSYSQIDRDQLSLDISKADAANMEELKAFVWKKQTVVIVGGVEKLTTLNELSVDENDSITIRNIDASTTVKKKRGIRGRVQQNAAQDKLEYVGKALQMALAYTFMSKGQLLDFFNKAEITEKDGIIEAKSKNVYVKGDMLTLQIESETHLFVSKNFSSIMDGDPISGTIEYAKFSSGISHVSKSMMKLPAKDAVIKSENIDYLQRVR